MSRATLSPLAQADIEDIWNFSVERFGASRAQLYLRDIQRAVEIVAADPRRGRSCDDVRAGYFKFPVGSQVLFFRLATAGIDIVRILHGSMDFEQHIPLGG